jgi:asparagine synthase (glutamine-hydrolysing)
LHHLNGMWAFVIYDRNKNELWGARDRFGVKPLYYYDAPDLFAFASEQKALIRVPEIKTNPSDEAMLDYLIQSRIETSENGFYTRIKELQPGCEFTVSASSAIHVAPWYTLSYNKQRMGKPTEKMIANVHSLCESAVGRRLRSDIRVGFCLSGGLDSSSIISLAYGIHSKQHLNQIGDKLIAFTAVNDNPLTDERKWAKIVVDKYGLDWKTVSCDASHIQEHLSELIRIQDIPLLTTSTIAQYLVMKKAANSGVRILIDGQGGDELFAGYAPFYTSLYLDLIRSGQLYRLFREFSKSANAPESTLVFYKSLLKFGIDIFSPTLFRKVTGRSARPELEWIRKDALKEWSDQTVSGDYKPVSVNHLLHHFFTGGFLKNLLRWEDRCSMAWSVESRTPFSDDHELIEYTFGLPGQSKIQDGWSKFLLRKAMNETLPQDICWRSDKLGFSTPMNNWITAASPWMKSIMSDLKSQQTGLVDHDKLFKEWDKIFSNGSFKQRAFAWRYVNLLLWKEVAFKD